MCSLLHGFQNNSVRGIPQQRGDHTWKGPGGDSDPGTHTRIQPHLSTDLAPEGKAELEAQNPYSLQNGPLGGVVTFGTLQSTIITS